MYGQLGADAFGGMQQQHGFPGFPQDLLGGAFGAPPLQPQQGRGGPQMGYGGLGLPQQPRGGPGGPFGGAFPPPQQPDAFGGARGFGGFGGIPPMPQQGQQPRPNYGGVPGGFGGPGQQRPGVGGFPGGMPGGFPGGFPGGVPGAGVPQQQQQQRPGGQQQQRPGGGGGGGFQNRQGGPGGFGGQKGGGDPIQRLQQPFGGGGPGGFDKGGFSGGKGGGGKGGGKGKQRPDDQQQQRNQNFGGPVRDPGPPPVTNANGTAAWTYGQTAKGDEQGKGGMGGMGMNMGKGGMGMMGGKGGKGMPGMGGYGKGYDMQPEVHSNVFVGNLQEGTEQSTLESAFSAFGAIHSCFVAAKDGRTYGFVKFNTVDSASRAITGLNGQNGWIVKIANKDMNNEGGKGGYQNNSSSAPAAPSGKVSHTNVFVGNLNEGTTEGQLEKVFKAYGQVDSCVVMNKTTDKTYGFVEFSTIAEAQAAVAGLNGQSGLLVKFANNDNQPTPWEETVPHSNLFVGSLPKGTTDRQLRDACEKHGAVMSCTIRSEAEAEKCYGFVKFSAVAGAKRCITALDGKDGWSVKVANHDVMGGGGKGGMPGMMGMAGPWGKGGGGKGWNDFKGGKGWDAGFKGGKMGGGWVWTNQQESDRPEPPAHDNLYIKNLPPGIKDDEVIKTFSEAGDVVECRVLSWDGVSECAALVRMATTEQAEKAKELYNDKVHENCHQKLSVALQQKGGTTVEDHCFVKGLHCTTTQDQIEKVFSEVGEVKWVRMLPLNFGPNPTKLPDCCALVQFSKAEEATAAIEKFHDQICPEVGVKMIVRFAEVQSQEKPEVKPNSNLYVKGWPVGFPDFVLQSVFQKYGQVVRIRLLENPDPEQPTCAALVQMSREEQATSALKALHGNAVSPPVPNMRVKQAGRDQTPSGNLYVTALPRTITEEQIRETFKKYGEVKRLRLLNQEKSPELRALVELSTPELATAAIRELDNTVPVFKGPVLSIQYASKRESGESKGGRKGGEP